jgi:hypothetical protein
MKITSYKIVEEYFIENLENIVNQLILDGWQPYGNMIVSVLTNNNSIVYTQAMIKLETNE